MLTLLAIKYVTKSCGFLVYSSVLSLLWFLPTFAQTPISCGQVITDSISTPVENDRYTFSATAGDVVTFRIVPTTNNFTPQMTLFSPGNQQIATDAHSFLQTLGQTGTYTLSVTNSGFAGSQSGGYQVLWQRPNNPCNASPIADRQTVKGNVRTPVSLNAYRFSGTAGQPVELQLRALTSLYDHASNLQLYDPDGVQLADSPFGVVIANLTKTGMYTVFVGTNLASGMAGNYTLTMGNVLALLSTPNGGEALLAGSTVTIRWQSFGNNPSIVSHDLFLSADGGVTFPTLIAGGLSGGPQSFDWNIPPALATNTARIRVVAKDLSGNSASDDSDASFAIVRLISATANAHRYDDLNRLIQTIYDDGTGITYSYDATGNRLTEVAGPVPYFRASCTQASISMNLGGSTTGTCTITSLNGFSGAVNLTCPNAPPGVTCGFNPATVTPAANGTINSTLTVDSALTSLAGVFDLQVKGASGTLSRVFDLTMALKDFNFAGSTALAQIKAGAGVNTTVGAVSLNGFNSAVSLSCPGLPAGITCSFNPASITPAAGGTANTTLTVNAAGNLSTGTYIFQVRGDSGSLNHTYNVSVTVVAAGEQLLLDEDFSNGIPVNWTVVNGGVGGGYAGTWTTANPAGRSIAAPLAAPFAIVDSDYATGDATQDEQLITPTINANSCGHVILEFSNQFQWFFRHLDEVADVDLSTDGGSTWTNVLRMQGADDGFPTPNTKSIDLTSAIGANKSSVRIRFHYYNGNFEWFWAIDNVHLRCQPAAPVQFNAASYGVSEGAGMAQITITRVGDTTGPASVSYATSNGSAKEGRDYVAALGVVSFAAGEANKTFPLLVIDNAFVDGSRTVNVVLSNPSGASLGSQSTAVLTITDNDSTLGGNPVDVPRSFVQLNYYDFLARYPDASGWDFWTNNITGCTPQPSCMEVQRINTSGAFFLSIEFQQTGYLVERMYKTAYGNATGNSTFGGAHQLPVPIVRFDEFLRDTQRIRQGVVVLAPGWEQLLEANKQTYANEFVQTSRFIGAFPTTMTPALFVDKLNQNAGSILSSTERTTAINLFAGAGDSSNVTARAQAVRQVAENANLAVAEKNRAFVLAQFFGYLRRDPNSGPDTDYTGYDFWLTKLNQFNGDYIAAEMVKAFIASDEYRHRFGP
jgi:YD repeat-containing protein